VHRRMPVPVSRRDAERALSALQVAEDPWEVFRLSRAPIRFVCAFWQELIREGLLRPENGRLHLADHARAWIQALRIPPAREFPCPRCEGRGVDLGGLREAAERFRDIARHRPAALQAFDQGYVTEDTALARVAFALERGDVEGKEVLVVGDDDLVSVALALAAHPLRVVAVDVDERIVRFIRDVARAEGLLQLEAHVYDVRDPLPEAWQGGFDTFFTDPTESLRGFRAFVDRGLLALRGEGSAGYFGLTHGESSLVKWARIQRMLLRRNAVLTDIRDGFNVYQNWDYVEAMRAWRWLPVRPRPAHLWYRSALFRIELLSSPRLVNRPVRGELLEDEEAATT
jgi:predicted methyltransferase